MPTFCRTCIQQVTDNSSVSINRKIDYERLLLCCVPEMDLRVIPDVRICNKCLTTINVIYKFKMRHRETEYKINNYLNEHGIFDQTRVSRLLFKNQGELLKIKQEFDVDETVCRTCLRQITTSFISLDESCKQKLLYCFPELDLWTVPDIKMCKDCYTALDMAYDFKTRCVKNEEAINNYLREHQIIDAEGLSVWFNCIIKIESNDTEFENEQLLIDQEEIDLDDNKHFRRELREDKSGDEEDLTSQAKYTSKNKFKCSKCEYCCVYKYQLKQHMLKHIGEKQLKCLQYEYSTTRKFDLKLHKIKKHTGKKPFQCLRCKYRSSHKSSLKEHMRTHTGVRFKCSQCEYSTIRKYTLKLHNMKKHAAPFECSHCKYRSPHKSNVQEHMRTHTNEPFKCSQCEYSTIRKYNLKLHIRTHTGEKPFRCLNCEYRTSDKKTLKRHVITHTGEKPYWCSYCEHRCTEKAKLKQHMRTHTGEKPFRCSYCEFRCAQKSNLKQHVLTHTGEKPFQCSHCEYRCIRKSGLDQHTCTHTDRSFKCSQCEYSTTRKYNLYVHLRTHADEKLCLYCKCRTCNCTNEKSFNCKLCQYSCANRSRLYEHIRKHISTVILQDVNHKKVNFTENILCQNGFFR